MNIEVVTKACPFCGHVENTKIPECPLKGIDYWVECPNCGATGPKGDDPIMAVGLWNTRPRAGIE